jgi:hypothetical protein
LDLGQLLVQEGLLDGLSLAQAQRVSAQRGQPLAEYLVEDRLLGEEVLLRTLRRRLGLPMVDLDTVPVDPEAVRLLPHEVAVRRRVFPFATFERTGRRFLRVAVADPLDEETLDEAALASGCDIEPVLGGAAKLPRTIERHYRDLATRVIPRRRSGPIPIVAPVIAPPAAPAAAAPPASADSAPSGPGAPPERARFVDVPTKPMHLVPAEADLAVRLDALIALLIRRGLLAEEEYAEEVRRMLKARQDLEG